MSRTDKDRPEWVMVMDPTISVEISHGRNCIFSNGNLECGLDDYTHENPRIDHATCWRWVYRGRHRCDTSKEERRYGYWKPERAKVRAVNRKFLIENSWLDNNREIDDSTLVVNQHRHGPFVGGYWD